jgi:toxin ParE1/3/4
MLIEYQFEISPRASREIGEILEYVSQDSPERAEALVRRIVRKIDTLDVLPGRYERQGWSRSTGLPVHSMFVDPYHVYYRIDEDNRMVTVMTIWHGRRQQPVRFP